MQYFSESEEQALMRKSLVELVSKYDTRYWREHDKSGDFPSEYYDSLAAGGWFGLNVPQECGGAGLGISSVSAAIREASRVAGMPAGDIIMAICTFGIQTVKSFAKEALRKRLLPELGSGKHVFSFGLTEPLAGVNTLDISTRARREGDGFVINGRKIWITLAHKATIMNVVARTTPKEGARSRTDGLTIFLVELGKVSQGSVKVSRIEDIAMRCLGSSEVVMEDVYVPSENVIGEVDRAWEILPTLLNAERISTASMSVGVGELVLGMAVEYAKMRKTFSKPLGSNQAIQFPLARAYSDLQTAWAETQIAASQFDNSQDCSVAANVAAYLGAGAAFYASDRAMQTYGGMAYSTVSDIERHWRDTRLLRTGPVPEEMVLSLLGQKILGLPRSY